jgi:hypothetical protein
MLLMHLYGGIPGIETTKGLSKVERQASGKRGGIGKGNGELLTGFSLGIASCPWLLGSTESASINIRADIGYPLANWG